MLTIELLFLVMFFSLVNIKFFLVVPNQVSIDKKVNIYLRMSRNSLQSDRFCWVRLSLSKSNIVAASSWW